jgi:hypothetical protein
VRVCVLRDEVAKLASRTVSLSSQVTLPQAALERLDQPNPVLAHRASGTDRSPVQGAFRLAWVQGWSGRRRSPATTRGPGWRRP